MCFLVLNIQLEEPKLHRRMFLHPQDEEPVDVLIKPINIQSIANIECPRRWKCLSFAKVKKFTSTSLKPSVVVVPVSNC